MIAGQARSALVLSAHSGDFVWRAGGAIALAVEKGYAVKVVCLSFGERGESQGLWKQPGMDMGTVKKVRREEAEAAAQALGAEIAFLDLGDYPLEVGPEAFATIVDHIRETQPEVLLTHVSNDPYNRDHNLAHETLLRARMVAQAQGNKTAHPPIGAPQVLMFEPHQSEMCGFVPNLLLDITSVFDRKRKAMECMSAQSHLIEYYSDLAVRRAVQAVRNGGARSITHAEAHQRLFPIVGEELL
ncbi:PIG-L deacetylase family protein [Prescottella agglutinans]|uniref:4-oxalomesaconate hydratase n=1 Tax=Prescottella agglutinans TaxID=1644129 RepID=A0ABT6M905_9NOCA|nr:PIG-L family deacetylase [Prescottella agglutinans]MDH6280777.1 4-oxalomesaconate hydratase [Prescottella agglutinans]